jgi:SAM-dependent methyltransferase
MSTIVPRSARVNGTEGYAEEAEALLKRYESASFADVHQPVLHLIPDTPSNILDIGSGTGRDAAALAAMGHRVVAVEPTDELRVPAMALHPSSRIEWINDGLPHLTVVMTRGETFDLVMLTAVWMHLDAAQRRHAMPKVASLLRTGGAMIMSLRHGPVPPGRRMFDVTADETVQLAREQDLHSVVNLRMASVLADRPDVSWTRLAFLKGQGRSPGVRHPA